MLKISYLHIRESSLYLFLSQVARVQCHFTVTYTFFFTFSPNFKHTSHAHLLRQTPEKSQTTAVNNVRFLHLLLMFTGRARFMQRPQKTRHSPMIKLTDSGFIMFFHGVSSLYLVCSSKCNKSQHKWHQ